MRRAGWIGILGAAAVAYFYREPLQRFFRRVSRLDLNTASREEFLALPGITPELADKIIENRPYNNVLDLVSRRVFFGDAFEAVKNRFGIGEGTRYAA